MGNKEICFASNHITNTGCKNKANLDINQAHRRDMINAHMQALHPNQDSSHVELAFNISREDIIACNEEKIKDELMKSLPSIIVGCDFNILLLNSLFYTDHRFSFQLPLHCYFLVFIVVTSLNQQELTVIIQKYI